jgi:dTDP-4-dehydrorhamnose 3,5-epimerase
MRIDALSLPGLLSIEPARYADERGLFSETYREDELAAAGFQRPFIQENAVRTTRRGTVRGLHFQAPPYAQDKLIRVARGAVIDVAVDLRRGSPTYGKALAIELSAENWLQLLVPRGFAHGYCTLTDDCEVLYKVSARYEPRAERGLLWSDPALGLALPIPSGELILNDRDAAWPPLSALSSPFSLDAGA